MENPYQAPESINLAPNPQAGGDGLVSNEVIRTLRMTKGWVRFLAVLGFVMTAFMVLGAFGIMFMANRSFMAGLAMMMGLAYLVFAVLIFFCGLQVESICLADWGAVAGSF